VDDPATRDALTLIDEQNFGWLNLADLSDAGRHQVLSVLGDRLVPYSVDELPATALRDDAITKFRELADLAKSTTG
jgi:hypothetical protein